MNIYIIFIIYMVDNFYGFENFFNNNDKNTIKYI